MEKMQNIKHRGTGQGTFYRVYLVLGIVVFLALLLVSPVSATWYTVHIKGDSNPTGASGYLDGTYLGTTPLNATKEFSKTYIPHVTSFATLVLKKTGYCDYETSIPLLSSAPTSEIHWNMGVVTLVKPSNKGWLYINSTPGADVYLDNIWVGKTDLNGSYSQFIEVGSHSLVLKKTGYLNWQETVTIITCIKTIRVIKLIETGTPALTVVSPNGGENLKPGSFAFIQWTSYGDVGSNVKIELLKAGALVHTVASSTPNDEFFNWNPIPPGLVPGKDYKVRITSTTKPAVTDSSNASFTIPPYIIVTSPASGDSWAPGSTHPITWKSYGDVGSNVKIELLGGGFQTLAARYT